MSSGQFEQMICDAIETLVDRAVAKADYDKTIQATILEHTDATIGKYKVKYQDSTFYAYAADVDANYSKGSSVYILIHSNDMEKDKTIIGAVEKLGLDYVPIIEDEDAYDKIGENCVEKTDDGISLCSYERNTVPEGFFETDKIDSDLQGDFLVLYDANLAEDNELQLLDLIEIEAIEHYIHQSTSLICGATFRTELPEEQKPSVSGNYGIEFDLAFNNNGTEVIRTYHINVNDMEGDPYNFSVGSQQYEIFDIDGTNFIRIDKVKIFCMGFPVAKENQSDDIFVSNVLIQAANRFSEEDLNGCFLSLLTPQGSIFKEGSRNELTLEAILRVKGKIVGDSQDVKYYWFRENPSITRESDLFHIQGGLGWECLNKTTTTIEVEEEKTTVTEFEPLGATYLVKAEDVKSKSARYKCVAVYNEGSFSAEVTLLNFDFEYELILETDSGNTVFHNTGEPIVTCKVNKVVGDVLQEVTDLSNYLFSWGEVNSYGQFTSWKSLKDLNKGQDNQIQVNMNKILTFATYKCAVYLQDGENTIYIGSAAIQLSNAPEQEDLELYSLVINNGSQVFKYNEAGVSPASKSLDNPLVIPELSFSLFDPTGKEVSPVESNIWHFPINNTMLELVHEGEKTEKDGYYVITNPKDGKLSYKIKETYNPSFINNTIKLIVTNNGTTYVETTTFLFVKEGDSGTNGTEYVLRILPNVKPDAEANPLYPMITKIGDTETYKWNFDAATAGEYLKLQMWKSGEVIYEGTDFGTAETQEILEVGEETVFKSELNIEWINLAHHYSKDKYDVSYIDITHPENTAIFTANYKEEDAPANIIQARVVYNDAFYSATTPIITSWIVDEKYKVTLKEDGGFTSVIYSADGMFPQYNKKTPFEVVITEKDTEGKEVDISQNFEYNWSIKGEINWTALVTPYLKEPTIKDEDLLKSQAWFQPVDRCNAECLTVGIYCEISQSIAAEDGAEVSNPIAWVHIPVHFLLNRYGQATLNGWDGNSIDINEEGGYILSPQVGAGRKEEDNSFTGVLMGEVKEYKDNSEISHNGIIGYHQGVKSLFINAEDGSAIFGKFATESTTPTGGQIIIDPSSEEALLYSSNFFKNYGEDGKPTSTASSNESKEGLLINLSKPEIRYGNGNFKVDKYGNLTALSGEIGGWLIGDNALYHTDYTVGMAAYDKDDGWSISTKVLIANSEIEEGFEEVNKAIAFWAGGYGNEENISNPKFFVSHDGYLKTTEASIGAGSNPIFIGKSEDEVAESAIYSFKKNSFNKSASQGFYLGETGLALGTYAYLDWNEDGTDAEIKRINAFEVTNTGVLTARAGYIGDGEIGWKISPRALTNGEKTSPDLAKDGAYLGTRGIGLGRAKMSLNYKVILEENSEDVQVDQKREVYAPAFWVKAGTEQGDTIDGLTGINRGYLAGTWEIDETGIHSLRYQSRLANAYWNEMEIDEDNPQAAVPAPEGVGLLNPRSYGISLLSFNLPNQIGRSIYMSSADKTEGVEDYYSYKRIVSDRWAKDTDEPYADKGIKRHAFELLDDGSLYARTAVVSTNLFSKWENTTGLYFGPEGLRVGSLFAVDKTGTIIKGPTPITSILINSDTDYTVFTNGGLERFIANFEE